MMIYHVRFDDGTIDYLAGRTLAQASQAAVKVKPGQGFTIREASDYEWAVLLAAHSLDPGVDDE